jgi:fructose-bisphosphate aldolase class II
LGKHQEYAAEQLKNGDEKPLFLVFHGGSGSTEKEIQEAVSNGVVKMNVGKLPSSFYSVFIFC